MAAVEEIEIVMNPVGMVVPVAVVEVVNQYILLEQEHLVKDLLEELVDLVEEILPAAVEEVLEVLVNPVPVMVSVVMGVMD